MTLPSTPRSLNETVRDFLDKQGFTDQKFRILQYDDSLSAKPRIDPTFLNSLENDTIWIALVPKFSQKIDILSLEGLYDLFFATKPFRA